MNAPGISPGSFRIGTCSWNYDSWMGLVYTRKSPTAAGYLPEYSRIYGTAEVDSWFYRLPPEREARDYAAATGPDFRFTCKVSRQITLTHLRDYKKPGSAPEPNPEFLSPELFLQYLAAVEPLRDRLEGIILEFEYLNRDKMPSLDLFLRKLEVFTASIPPGLPLAVETRNKGYLCREYFQFLRERNLAHVFSEKQYMPRIYDVHERYGDLLAGAPVLRLLGEDREGMEKASGDRWDRRLTLREDLSRFALMTDDLIDRGFKVTVNVNNHFEGSSPLTIRALLPLMKHAPAFPAGQD